MAERNSSRGLGKTGIVTSLLAAVGTMGLVEDLVSWRETFVRFWAVWDQARVLIFKIAPFEVDRNFQEVLIVSWIYAGFLTRVLATIPPSSENSEPSTPANFIAQISLFVIFSLIIAIVGELTLGRNIHGHRAPGDMLANFDLLGAQGVFFLVIGCLMFSLFRAADRQTRTVAAKSMGWTTVGVFLLVAFGAKLG